MSFDRDFRDFDRRFEQATRRTGKAFAAWFGFCAVFAVATLAVLGWALIKVVNHFT